ncbi:unnamed protein product [Microthlaspi erraticum]|uniref:Transmembrane protein n=1 Tax=Microthlaspi erraticum TaxID=1685480 RepID=A0A6D2I9Y6_9BRAS|nr:unnamed protein product [Microthlaspi erraticum]
MRSLPPSPSPAYTENITHHNHHHIQEDFTLMIILLVLYGIIAIRYVTTKEENRETNLSFRRPQPPRPLPPPQPPIMRPQQIEAVMVKDVVVEVEFVLSDLSRGFEGGW